MLSENDIAKEHLPLHRSPSDKEIKLEVLRSETSGFLSPSENTVKTNESTVFNYTRKKMLANKIGNIKNKKNLIKIFKLMEEDPICSYTENNNGMLLFFDKFSIGTYMKLEKFMEELKTNAIDTDRLMTTDNSNDTPTSDNINYSQDEYANHNIFTPKLKLSNKEKNLLNRKKYDKAISDYTNTD